MVIDIAAAALPNLGAVYPKCYLPCASHGENAQFEKKAPTFVFAM
jgi:hypothetical protein